MNKDGLDLLGDICALLSLSPDLGPPILRTVARVGVRTIKCDGLKGVVVLRPLGVGHIQLPKSENVVAVLSPGTMDALTLGPCLGGVQSMPTELVTC